MDTTGDIPMERNDLIAVPYDGNILLLGGRNQYHDVSHNHIYYLDTETMEWSKKEMINSPCLYGASAVIFGSKLILIGGGILRLNTYLLDLETFVWSEMIVQGQIPMMRWQFTCNLINDKVYVHAGSGRNIYYNDIHSLNLTTAVWSCEFIPIYGVSIPYEPQRRNNHTGGELLLH